MTARSPAARSSGLTPRLRPGLAALLAATVFTAASLCVAARPSSAEEGDEEGAAQGIEEELKAQMQKILQLMRENESALLEASRLGGREPGPVDVKPPDVPPAGSTGEPTEPKDKRKDAPPEKAEQLRRRMDELIRGSTERSRAIPKELEELVRMIPTTQSQTPPSDPSESQKDAEARRREEAKKPPESSSSKPEDGRPGDDPKPKDRDGDPPKAGAQGDPPPSDVPPWLAELPDEVRRRLVAQDFEDVPEKYRKLIQRYQRWLAERAGQPSR